MRGDQLARQWRILRLIEGSKHGLTISELAKSEGKSVRSIYRDLEALQEAGFPLYAEKVDRAQKWAFIDTYAFQVPQPFALTELMSLHLYSDLIRMFKGTAFYDSLESLFKKVRATLSPESLAYLERVQSSFAVGIRPYKEYSRFREIINQVNQAVTERQRVEIAYHSLRRDAEVIRKVDPFKIWFFEGTIYLIGLCHLRNEVRMFVMDRIKMLRLMEEKFKIPPDFKIEDFMRHSFKVMQDKLHTVKIRISSAWARWVGEKIWHESQKSRALPDGGLELTFQVAGLDEIKMWVLSLGPEAIVLEPEQLIAAVKASLNNALELYAAVSKAVKDIDLARAVKESA